MLAINGYRFHMQDMDRVLGTEFEDNGVVWFRGLLSDDDLNGLSRPARAGERLSLAGLSGLLARGGALYQAITGISPSAFPVRAVAFDKGTTVNWGVPWHQDRVVAVAERKDISGVGGWSKKAGIWHCSPPLEVLKTMFFARIHIDDQGPNDGAMEYAVGSHKAGVVDTKSAADVAARYPICDGTAKRGDVLLLKALVLHGSPAALVPSSRRALRIDFATRPLPNGMDWAEAGWIG